MNQMLAFAPLQAAYDDRLAAALSARAQGQKVLGFVGNTVPAELIRAAGAFALRLAPISGDTPFADRYAEALPTPMRGASLSSTARASTTFSTCW